METSAAQADEFKVVSFNLRRDFGPQRKTVGRPANSSPPA